MNSVFKLSKQGMMSFVMLFQKALIENRDISEIMSSMEFMISDDDELVCLNPPTIEIPNSPNAKSEGFIGLDEEE